MLRLRMWIVVSAVNLGAATSAAAAPHNLVLFVPDGLRSQLVDAATAPTMARVRDEGVDFRNSHSMFPTFTTANASAFATGHALGDTGDFSNLIYSGFRVVSANATVAPFLESDPVLREVNDYYHGNYLDETSIVAAAREHGYATAVIGKLGPSAIFDVGSLKSGATLIVDDSTGAAGQEVPLSEEWKAAFAKYRIPQTAPSRGDNGNGGSLSNPGTWIPNLAQQQYFLEVAVKVALPHFKDGGRPFVLVFWSRDPDGTQHNQGDSLGTLSPGINGPSSLAAVRSADTALGAIEQALRSLQLFDSTDIIVAADHGFSTISREAGHSVSVQPKTPYKDVARGQLPLGFLAIDLYQALKPSYPRWRLFDPDDSYRELDWTGGVHPLRGNGLLGEDPDHPGVVVVANGGSDLIYIPERPPTWAAAAQPAKRATRASPAQSKLIRSIVTALLDQDYVSGIFVDEGRFGKIAGALSTDEIGVGGGKAVTPPPALVVNFASFVVKDCVRTAPTLCGAEISDTGLQQGQGMHGSLSRADTWSFMAARGPDFQSHFTDSLPASNADIGMTIARILGLMLKPNGILAGRVLAEALSSSAVTAVMPPVTQQTLRSDPDPRHHLITVLNTQTVDGHTYIDSGGFAGRTLGLEASQGQP